MTDSRVPAVDPAGADPAVQHLRGEAIRLFRAGRELSRHHKEGGERLFFDGSRFLCERYGDDGDSREAFTDPEAFLDFLWRSRHWKYPGTTGAPDLTDAEAWQKIVQRLVESRSPRHGSAASAPAQAEAVAFYHRYRRMMLLLALGAALVFIAAGLLWNRSGGLLQVRTIGSPAGGEAIGTPREVLLIISRQQPYMPSLHRDPSQDRYDLSLLVEPRAAGEKRQVIGIVEGYQAGGALQHAAKPVGFDGRVAWFRAGGLTGWDTVARRVITEADVRRSNRLPDDFWNEAWYEVNGGLIASTRDNRILVRIDPKTLQVETLGRKPPPSRPFPPHPVDAYRMDAEPAEPEARMTSWLRSGIDAPVLRLDQPGSRLRIHYRRTGITTRMLIIARIDDAGNTLWSAETGIGDLHQILPDPAVTALIGDRPPIPDRATQPVITFVDSRTGNVRTESLVFGR